MLLSAVAVEREMVGKDSDAELIGGLLLFWGPHDPLAASNADCADCCSCLGFCEDEKSWLNRLDLA